MPPTIDAHTIHIYTARIMDNSDPNTMNRLKRKVADNGGTVLFDMQFLLGFLYITPQDIFDPLDDESESLVLVERHDKRMPVPVDE